MIDIHLINVALAGLGIGAGAIVLIAVAILCIAAISQHRTALRRASLPVRPAISEHKAATSPVASRVGLGERAA